MDTLEVILEINLTVTLKDGKPVLDLRKVFTDLDQIRLLVSSAWHNRPLVIIPKVADRFRFINNLQQKGLVTRNKDTGEYNYNF